MPQEAKVILQADAICKSYGDHQVLNNLSFQLKEGEQLAIIGPSGSGKSTLINILTRSIPYDSGLIELDEKKIEDYKDNATYAKKIGVIRQQFDLVKELEVIHNVLAGNLHQWSFFQSLFSLIKPKNEDQALDALREVGIEAKAYNVLSSLSGGEQQRVAIARLLVQDPEIFVADEPIASLDPARADQVMDLLTHLCHEKNKTLLASMHSVDHVLKYFDRVIGIRKGQIVLDSQINELKKDDLEKLYDIQEVDHEEIPDALPQN